ncbi:cytochrome P450 [Xylariales sp. PMI_506]|nr:cytochrome P450 [Xylariales sp. PMI_506]
MISTTAAAVFIALLLLSQLVRRLLVPCPLPGIPYNRLAAWAPWGDLAAIGVHNLRSGEVFDWLSLQCLRHRSAVVQVLVPSFSLTSPVVLVADLPEIEDIATRRLREIDRASLMHDFFGLLVPGATIGMKTGAQFKQQRRLWNGILSPGFLGKVAGPVFCHKISRLTELWKVKAQLAEGCAFEAVEDIRQTALDAMWTMATGSNLGLLDDQLARLSSQPVVAREPSRQKITFRLRDRPPFYRGFSTLLVCLDWVAQGVSPRLYTWFFNHAPFFHNAQSQVDTHLYAAIRDARERRRRRQWQQLPGQQSAEPTCALDLVLRQDPPGGKDPESSGATSDQALHDELLELLITGHETTASSTGWALKYLTDNQEAQGRLRRALLSEFSHAPTTGAAAQQLPSAESLCAASIPYLDATVAEVLRLSRTGPVSFREAIVDTEILGHRIPAGTPLILVTAGPSYDRPDLVKKSSIAATGTSLRGKPPVLSWDPSIPESAFAPERWLDARGEFDPGAGPSLPFSAGPRGCFGKKIALLELRLMIALFVMSFEFPKLPESLSRYSSYDGLTRKPTCCFINPKLITSQGFNDIGQNCKHMST